jgi:hypothetical protein
LLSAGWQDTYYFVVCNCGIQTLLLQAMNPKFELFSKQITNPVKFRFFMLQRLPAALFAGLRIKSFTEQDAVITVRYKWFNQNPFRSMYFAVQSMAAEMSTGLLASGQVYERNPAVSMLVVGLEAQFLKKAVDTISFTCADGHAIANAVETAIRTGESVVFKAHSTGRNEAGEVVSEFWITWSFKIRGGQKKE